MPRRTLRFALAFVPAATLAGFIACSGGDGGSAPPPNHPDGSTPAKDAAACEIAAPDAKWSVVDTAHKGSFDVAQIDFDEHGQSYLIGKIEGSVDFGAGPVLGEAPNDGVTLVSFDANGKVVFTRRYGEVVSGFDREGVAALPEGGAVMASQLEHSDALFQGGLVVEKVSATGAPVWTQALGASVHPQIAVDRANGDIVLSGDVVGAFPFPGCSIDVPAPQDAGASDAGDSGAADGGTPEAGPRPTTRPNVLLARLDASGKCLWSKKYGGNAAQTVTKLAITSSGEMIVAGELTGTLDLGGGPLVGPPDPSPTGSSLPLNGHGYVFLAKLGKDGTHVWSHAYASLATSQTFRWEGMAVAPDGSIAALVTIPGVVDFGAGGIGKSGSSLALVTFDRDGNVRWQKSIPISAPGALAVDATSNVWIASDYSRTLDLGGGSVVPPAFSSWDSNGFFVASYDAAGTFRSATPYHGCSGQSSHVETLGVAPSGDVLFGASMDRENPGGSILSTFLFAAIARDRP